MKTVTVLLLIELYVLKENTCRIARAHVDR